MVCNADGIRQDCGFWGIAEDECDGRGCCWNPVLPNPTNISWCYFQTTQTSGTAHVDRSILTPLWIILGVMAGVLLLFFQYIWYLRRRNTRMRLAELEPEPLCDNVPPAANARETPSIEYKQYWSPGAWTIIFTIAYIVLFALRALHTLPLIWPYGFIPLTFAIMAYFILGYRVIRFDTEEGVFSYHNVRCWRLCHFRAQTIRLARLRGISLRVFAHRTEVGGARVPIYAAQLERMRQHDGTPFVLPLGTNAGELGPFDVALAKKINALISKFNGGVTVERIAPADPTATSPALQRRTPAAAEGPHSSSSSDSSDDGKPPAFCPYCGHKVRDREAQFCGKCGKRIAAAGKRGSRASKAFQNGKAAAPRPGSDSNDSSDSAAPKAKPSGSESSDPDAQSRREQRQKGSRPAADPEEEQPPAYSETITARGKAKL